MTTHTLILCGVFIYFAIGGFIAGSLTVFSIGFAGRFEPMAIAIFFFWPLFYLLQIPFVAFILIGSAVAALMTWLVSLLLGWLA